MTNAPALFISNLIKHYGPVEAVNDVSFQVNAGEIFGLLGPNGAGKTSIISVVVTLERATSGQVQIFGHSVDADVRKAKSLVGIVPQEIVNHGFFSVLEVLKFISGFYGRRKNIDHIHFLLKRLNLWDHRDKNVKQLSGGMRRRLMIAKALVHEPRLLLLDEPTAGVDIELRATLWDFVRELRARGVAVLLTTHYLEEAEQLCDRVAFLHRGRIQKMGPTKELVRTLTQRTVRLILRETTEIHHPRLVRFANGVAEFQLAANEGVGQLLDQLALPKGRLHDIETVEGDLEDAFRSVLSGEP
jgi:ABC-2 type transport system ATP-binding protein